MYPRLVSAPAGPQPVLSGSVCNVACALSWWLDRGWLLYWTTMCWCFLPGWLLYWATDGGSCMADVMFLVSNLVHGLLALHGCYLAVQMVGFVVCSCLFVCFQWVTSN